MPILTVAAPPVREITAVVAAYPGLTVSVSGGPTGVPPGGPVVAWAQLADPSSPGGDRVDPVFLAAGRTWTPDQFRAVYGAQSTVSVAAQ